MHRIDDPNATPEKLFTEGDPISNTPPPTKITDDWLNDLQEEVCNLIEAAGITLVKGTRDQLVEAVAALIVSGAKTGTLTGYSSGAGTVAGTDTILQAIQKLNGNAELKLLTATAESSYRRVLARTSGLVTLGNSNVETDILSFTLPGGSLSTNRILRVRLFGRWSHDGDGSNACRFKLKYGGTTVTSGSVLLIAAGAVTNEPVILDFSLRGNNGASAQIGHGLLMTDNGQVSQSQDYGTASENSASDLTVKVTAKWDTADTSETVSLAGEAEIL